MQRFLRGFVYTHGRDAIICFFFFFLIDVIFVLFEPITKQEYLHVGRRVND